MRNTTAPAPRRKASGPPSARPRPSAGRRPALVVPTGRLVLVVGPDPCSLEIVLAAVRRRLRADAAADTIEFPARLSTRRRNPAVGAIGISRRVFHDMCTEGSFLLHWTDEAGSHGVPIDVRAALERGATVVVAAPPSAVADARDAWHDVRVITVTGHTDQARRTLTARACFDRMIRVPRALELRVGTPSVAVHCGAHISPAIDGLTRALLAQIPALPVA